MSEGVCVQGVSVKGVSVQGEGGGVSPVSDQLPQIALNCFKPL